MSNDNFAGTARGWSSISGITDFEMTSVLMIGKRYGVLSVG